MEAMTDWWPRLDFPLIGALLGVTAGRVPGGIYTVAVIYVALVVFDRLLWKP